MMTGLLRIELSDRVEADRLCLLHELGLGGAEGELKALIIGIGGVRLKAVYQLSEAELRSDTHGFSGEFELELRQGIDQNAAIDALVASPWVIRARAVVLRATME